MISELGDQADAHSTCIVNDAQLALHRLPNVGGFPAANAQPAREAAERFAFHHSYKRFEFEGG